MSQAYSPRFEPTLLSMMDRAARRLRLGAGPLDASQLVSDAERRAGRALKTRELEPGLRALIDSCEREADLSIFGRFSLKWDAQRRLRTVLRFEAEEEANPDILEAEVPAPIFVSGLPRSGTTFLHMLLAQDPQLRAPLAWETIFPYPEGDGRDRRVRQVEREFQIFRRLAPGIGALHPLAATTPQECTEITAHIFQSLRYDTTYHVPSYLGWLDRRGHAAAFRFHRRFLQHLQAQDDQGEARGWVLKCPDNVYALEAILEAYPDAGFVFVHRDPTAVMPSLLKLTEVLRSPFTRTLDKAALGAEVTQRTVQNAECILASSQILPQDRVIHLHFDEVTADPAGAVERVYRRFGRPYGAATRARIEAFVRSRPRGGYEVNRYDPAEFGLDLGRIRRQFAPYLDAYCPPAARAARA